MLVADIAHEVSTPLGAIGSAGASLNKVLGKLGGRIDETDRRLVRTLEVGRDSTQIVDTATERVSEIVQRLKRPDCMRRGAYLHWGA
jgi:signal transduction histidine kinase